MTTASFIPVANPQAGLAPLMPELQAAIERVLQSGRYVLGAEVTAFEAEFANFIGAEACVGVANGTDALELALRSVGVGPGDEVLTVANTVTATASAIAAIGARPRFVEVDKSTFNMCPDALATALQSGSAKAIVPVHLYGGPADLTAICDLAARYGIPVVEDCAQAVGATWADRPVGSWGQAAAFSFYPTKNLGCLGDGGAIVTRDLTVAERARALRQYGWQQRYVATDSGGRNSRLDEIQAAVLRTLLPHLPAFNQRRREIAQRYLEQLAEVSHLVTLPSELPKAHHVYHQFVVRASERDALQTRLAAAGVGTAVLYPEPIHRQPAFAQPDLSLPVTERCCAELLCLPIYPGLEEAHVDRVSRELISALQA
ncbi:DegT/DnrJ/EryC1/StrS family aminotransferase [Actomonas aquatica]|uniref:DegT/DnrJ/EryC1/StrS family aminotransferase n=1 Tax=Actomonas aquatica TaxID=2866162 RepID=A0ABZ1CB01_9BACT|nr:DegT/DnrJ/EryC1/StrS family aminotransferase [Opitutus sp. WL0086]WRQ88403.1 DegT/DnrJ/EryC1/StrS family aminotransferase [Opitutus sp. WL0086]